MLRYVSSTGAVFRGTDIAGADEAGAPVPARGAFNDEYSQSKGLAEGAVLRANGRRGVRALATAAVRPNGIWGPGETHHFGKVEVVAKLGLSCVALCPHARTDFTHVANLTAALLLAADRLTSAPPPDGAVADAIAGRAYFVTDGRPQSTGAFFAKVTSRLGFAPPSLTAPTCLVAGLAAVLQAAAAASAVFGGRPEPFLTLSDVRKLSADNFYDSSAARRDLRYAPVVTEEEGVAAMVECMRARGFDGAVLLPTRAARCLFALCVALALAAARRRSGTAWRLALWGLASARVLQALAVFRVAWSRNWNAGGNAAAALVFGCPVTRAVLAKARVPAARAVGRPEAVAAVMLTVLGITAVLRARGGAR